MDRDVEFFKVCSSCRCGICFGGAYYRCSVSTCNRKRTAMFFCSVACWDAHRGESSHRDAWAEEATAPSRTVWLSEQRAQARPERKVSDQVPAAPRRPVDGRTQHEVLVVVSKLKEYVRTRAPMNVSDRGLPVLSDHIRMVADLAVQAAGREGRKTVMDRDVLPLFDRERRNWATGDTADDAGSGEVLVVVTKLKKYIKARSGMNTSDSVMPVISEHLRHVAREAIRHAAKEDRRTVLGRDFSAVCNL